jgi:hypothetical protein
MPLIRSLYQNIFTTHALRGIINTILLTIVRDIKKQVDKKSKIVDGALRAEREFLNTLWGLGTE